MAMPSLRQRLRESTDRAHRELEAAVEREGLLQSATGYERFLLGWHRLQAAVEGALDAAGAERLIPDWHERRRLALLETDLRELGLAVPSHPDVELRLASDGAVLGAAYVLEGAALGARVVQPAIESLGPPVSGAVRFLTGAGAESGRQWRAFVDLLERRSGSVDHAAAVEAAHEVFALAETVLIRRAEAA